jgi:DNA-binding protein HU-beta
MNKLELVSKVAESANITKVAAEKALKSVLDVITQSLANDEHVVLVGFGSFKVVTRAARTVRNPQTGNEMKVDEKKVVRFKVGKTLKDSVCVKPKADGVCG